MDEMIEGQKITRRDFMSATTWAIGIFIGLGIAVPAGFYIIGPALQELDEPEWILLGSTSKVEPGTPTLYKAKVERQTGWIVNEEEIAVYVLTEDGRNFIAMSNICTHLGCRVRWIGDQEQFFCPCHNGVFGKGGEVIAGPVPRPLDRYDVKVEDGQLYMLGG